MKNFLAKLKAMDKKKAVVDHFEKGILGVVGLFVLVCLGGTSWSRYDKQPKDFQDKVEAGERNIQASAFTVEEQAKYKPLDIMGFVQTLQSPLEVSRFNYSTDWFWPMYPTAIKITEPKWLAPVEPIADFGKAVIVEIPQDQLQSSKVAVEVADAGSAKKPVATDDDDEFAVKRGANAPNTSGGSGVGAAAETADAINVAGAANAYKNLGGGGSGGSGTSAMMNMNMMGTGSGMSTNTNMVNARGNRFVSVRAVFPLGDQIEELAKSMHEQRQKAADFVNFLDFEVERQVALPGDKTWSGPWEKVDLQATLD